MSIPPQFSQHRSAESAEDCRDFLRTGRCKYGASCKYNHPANVASGGGMRTPLDPSEPLFPVRPNEPICQYYMKHGTCKFGQTCKFNHPPQLPMHPVMNDGPPLMGTLRKNESPQFMVNALSSDPSAPPVMLQFLPQRPDEPDCIYFLKNGRCKYGATCRYHHPINFSQRRADEGRRNHLMQSQEHYMNSKVHFIAQAIPASGHVIVAESPVTFVNVDGAGNHGYQALSIVSNHDVMPSYSVPAGSGIVTEQGSANSSIASSYETTSTNFDIAATAGDPTAALWLRARRNGSGSSLAANSVESAGHVRPHPRVSFPHSVSDGSIASRRTRAASHGSSSDHSMYYENSNGTVPRTSGPGSWRPDRSVSFDHTRRSAGVHFSIRAEAGELQAHDMGSVSNRQEIPVPSTGNYRVSPRRNQRHGEGDEGFTMMTSALLNMLDTQEEVATESFSDDEIHRASNAYRFSSQHVDISTLGRLSLESSEADVVRDVRVKDDSEVSWSPRWRSPESELPRDEGGRRMVMVRSQHAHVSSADASHGSDIGLFLP